MKGHLFVLKNIPVKSFVTFITAGHVSVSTFLHFAHLQDSSRSKTKKQEKVLWSMVYFYDNVLVQYVLNFC